MGRMLRLAWLETKIFVREPMGLVGTVGVPVLIFVVLARLAAERRDDALADVPLSIAGDLPIVGAMFIIATTVLSLVTIIAIYREGGSSSGCVPRPCVPRPSSPRTCWSSCCSR